MNIDDTTEYICQKHGWECGNDFYGSFVMDFYRNKDMDVMTKTYGGETFTVTREEYNEYIKEAYKYH